jgi:tight adherence protein B
MLSQPLILFFLVTASLGGVLWVFVYPHLSGEKKAEKRMAEVARNEPVLRTTRNVQRSRRVQIEETLKQVEERNKTKKVALTSRLAHAGLAWSKQKFLIVSGALGIVFFLIVLLFDFGLVAALAAGFAASFGLPRWILRILKRRREAKFLNNFPDAVDVIVRGIKAGLPLMDSLRVVAVDASEPVKSEFRQIIETQAIGMPIGEACGRLFERMPVPEANFFGIVILIQQKAGGNLSEALGNLSRVLRERKRMKAKINAMSMEAKASASIIAALPICVMTLVWLTSPGYIGLLWTTPIGRMMLAVSLAWMTCGVLVMKKMINFDF